MEEGTGQPSAGCAPPPLDVNARRALSAQKRGSACADEIGHTERDPAPPGSVSPQARDAPPGTRAEVERLNGAREGGLRNGKDPPGKTQTG